MTQDDKGDAARALPLLTIAEVRSLRLVFLKHAFVRVCATPDS
jgi:hypothetical protein